MSNLFCWKGVDFQSHTISGRYYADSKTDLKYALYQQQIVIKRIDLQQQFLLNLRRWLNNQQTLFFLAQLYSLLSIGLNLNRAVAILEQNQSYTLLAELTTCLKQQLAKGEQLSTTLSLFPELFDKIILQLVRSGEATGQIDTSVQQAFDYYDQKQKTLSQFLTALLYPAVLFLVSMGVLATLVIFVIPQFESIYSQSKSQLPGLTIMILSISDWLSLNLRALCVGSFIGATILLILQRHYKFQWTQHIPFVGKTIKKLNTLRFCQTLTGLYAAGLNITDCLNSCRNLSSSHEYQHAIDQTLNEIKNGRSLAAALASSNYFDTLMIQLIQTGEESANLSAMLDQCSHYYQEQLKNNFDRLKIILEPILIVFLGFIIGIILIAMYLPVFNLGASF